VKVQASQRRSIGHASKSDAKHHHIRLLGSLDPDVIDPTRPVHFLNKLSFDPLSPIVSLVNGWSTRLEARKLSNISPDTSAFVGTQVTEIIPLLNFGRCRKSVWYWLFKRSFDIVASALLLILLSPLLAIVAVIIRFESRGKVLFRQERMGERFSTFTIYKFRTMYDGVPDRAIPIVDSAGKTRRPTFFEDPRVTKIGRFLRATSIDELPQLLNILRGEMSFVGPRPLKVDESLAMPFDSVIRYSVPAGLTGLAQIRDRSIAFDPSRFRPDLEYVHNLGVWQDIKIMFKTLTVLIHDY
jgi:lipopolysaccharide/colanic/teichoic acid biosynthesis glycosyltransferase